MSEMIERVILAIETTMDAHWDNYAREYDGRMEQAVAIAVIGAMREPTAAMLAALSDAIADGVSDERKLQRVIDAALRPPPNS